jgi:hypothetical protein
MIFFLCWPRYGCVWSGDSLGGEPEILSRQVEADAMPAQGIRYDDRRA